MVTFVLRLRSSRRREHVHWTQIFLATLVEGSYCICFESLDVGGQQTLGCGYVRCKEKHAPNELTIKKQILVNEHQATEDNVYTLAYCCCSGNLSQELSLVPITEPDQHPCKGTLRHRYRYSASTSIAPSSLSRTLLFREPP